MASFFDRLMGRTPTKGSSSKAKERLQFVLVHDRMNLPPERLEAMKQEILAVISKYVSVDDKNVDIALQQRDRDSLLIAEIPFSKRSEGIEQDDDEFIGIHLNTAAPKTASPVSATSTDSTASTEKSASSDDWDIDTDKASDKDAKPSDSDGSETKKS
jgi:cell division topological specificity factor